MRFPISVTFRIALVVFAPLLATLIAQQAMAQSPCDALKKPVLYNRWVPVSDKLKSYIEQYREAWRPLCERKAKVTVSMHELLEKARIIESSFQRLLPKLHKKARSLSPKQQRKFYEVVHRSISEIYPSFIPAFEGSVRVREFFRPNLNQFQAFSMYGQARDRAYFAFLNKIQNKNNAPWIRKVADYAGCTKFGDYDWIGTLKEIYSLKGQFKSDSKYYRRTVRQAEMNLLAALSPPSKAPICACGDQVAVVKDLKKVSNFYKTHSKKIEARLKNTEALLTQSKLQIRSYSVDKCSSS